MSDWTDDYQKPELIRISEQINRKKEEKKEIEIALSETKLQYRYIPVRKNIMWHKALLQLVLLVVTLLIATACMGNILSVFLALVLLLFAVYLFIKEVKTVGLLILSCNMEIAIDFADRHDIKTFPREEKRVTDQIKTLQFQIDKLEQEIEDLELKKKEYIKAQEEREATLRKHGVLFDEKPDKKASGSFSLKESANSYVDTSELYEYYIRDERYENEYLMKLNGQLQYIEKEISQLHGDFENARKRILFFIIIFILVAVVQSSFEGVLSSLTNIICFVASIFGVLYLYKTCKQPIIMYLIEQESNLTKEYAFIHNLVPIKTRRIDLLEEKERCEKEIAEIKKKRAELSFD